MDGDGVVSLAWPCSLWLCLHHLWAPLLLSRLQELQHKGCKGRWTQCHKFGAAGVSVPRHWQTWARCGLAVGAAWRAAGLLEKDLVPPTSDNVTTQQRAKTSSSEVSPEPPDLRGCTGCFMLKARDGWSLRHKVLPCGEELLSSSFYHLLHQPAAVMGKLQKETCLGAGPYNKPMTLTERMVLRFLCTAMP